VISDNIGSEADIPPNSEFYVSYPVNTGRLYREIDKWKQLSGGASLLPFDMLHHIVVDDAKRTSS
jgi:hypothetical protein